ncbi:MAG: rnhB [Magnetococcales bacterium]|nr:rnhB [Magnetococcales bacterium]HIJ83804.1 ribonuclease HII [Magnetococcales bacterium]
MAVKRKPDLEVEGGLWREGKVHVCGVDEVGRGPLAGPVVAAAVVFSPGLELSSELPGLDDSKRLTPGQRSLLEERIRRVAVAVGVGQSDVAEIDRLNIRRASLLAMKRAVESLSQKTSSLLPDFLLPDFLLIDGRDLLEQCIIPSMAIKGGDGTSASIAAASIIAKETRDRLMCALAEECPGYGWERNMGYPTQEHRQALTKQGVTRHHRHTFKPVADVLAKET